MRRVALVMVAVLVAASSGPAEARPQYLKGFKATYPNFLPGDAAAKCSVCHCGESKKVGNDYAGAIQAALGDEKNVKAADRIAAALREAEAAPSSVPGLTFGDLIRRGEMPGKCP